MTVLVTVLPLTPNFHLNLCLKKKKKKSSARSALARASTEKPSRKASLSQPYLSFILHDQRTPVNDTHSRTPREMCSHDLGKQFLTLNREVFLGLSFLDLYRFKTMPFTLWILVLPRFPASWLLNLHLLLLISVFSTLLKFYYIYTSETYRIVVPLSLCR